MDKGCVAPAPPIPDAESRRFNRLDAVWLLFLAGLAALPPRWELHKQIILLAIGVVQLLEGWLIARFPKRGVSYVVLLKILLATLLIDHTGEVGINSSYYPVYFLPVVTAAIYCGPWMTLFWTLLSSAFYCSYLYPAMLEYELTPEALSYLAQRILFFLLAAMIVNRFAEQSRHQTASVSRSRRAPGGNQSPPGASPGRSAPLRTSRRPRPALGRIGPRDS